MLNNTTEREIIEYLADKESRQLSANELIDLSVNPPKKEQKNTDHPDAKKHQIVSFIKSGVRILGYILIPFDLISATITLIVSEVIGIIEELV